MSVYIGPCCYGTPEPDSGERFITADSNNAPANTISVVGDLDMKKHRIFNVKEPRPDEPSDATTVEYVGRLATTIFNNKVDWSGGTMTGELSMGSHKITDVGNPENNNDATNKIYVDQLIEHEHDIKPYDLGRYIVFPHDDGTKVYFSVRGKKNIDLDIGKVVELKHNIRDSSDNEFIERPQDITITKDVELLPNPGKKLGVMELNTAIQIRFKSLKFLPAPWTLLFSVRPGVASPLDENSSIITFLPPQANQRLTYLTTIWASRSFKYALTDDNVITNENATFLSVDTTQLNHIAIQYTGNKLSVWLNGKQEGTHNEILGNIYNLSIGVKELGIISLYDRSLSKQEIIQHFVDHHVESFTNDEVLI